jgi:hypothetical protein
MTATSTLDFLLTLTRKPNHIKTPNTITTGAKIKEEARLET